MKQIVSNRKALMAVFNSEESLKKAIQILHDTNGKLLDIRTPYEIELPDIKNSKFSNNAGRITFWSGLIGFVLSFAALLYLHNELPIQFAIKPTIPWISLIIPAFIATILFAAIGLGLSFAIFSHIIPGQKTEDYNYKSSNDSFILLFNSKETAEISDLAIEFSEIDYLKQEVALPFPIKMEVK